MSKLSRINPRKHSFILPIGLKPAIIENINEAKLGRELEPGAVRRIYFGGKVTSPLGEKGIDPSIARGISVQVFWFVD